MWFVLAIAFLIVSVFPQIFDLLAKLTGVFSTTNFVFMFFIAILLVICFNLSVRNSQAETKIKELTQEIAIERFERRMEKIATNNAPNEDSQQ